MEINPTLMYYLMISRTFQVIYPRDTSQNLGFWHFYVLQKYCLKIYCRVPSSGIPLVRSGPFEYLWPFENDLWWPKNIESSREFPSFVESFRVLSRVLESFRVSSRVSEFRREFPSFVESFRVSSRVSEFRREFPVLYSRVSESTVLQYVVETYPVYVVSRLITTANSTPVVCTVLTTSWLLPAPSLWWTSWPVAHSQSWM